MVTINRALLAMCLAGLPVAIAHEAGTAGHHNHGSAQQTQQTGSTEQRQISTVEAQKILKEKGFYNGPTDGIGGPRTRSALREYQRSENLSVTGQLDQQTMQHMAMSLDEGEGARARSVEPMEAQEPIRLRVRYIQSFLRDEGMYKGPINGVVGSSTKAAIRKYQQRENLSVTGKLDQETLQHMVKEEEAIQARIGDQLNMEGERGRTATPETQHQHHEQ
ncbi:MAG: peptidoglycan-binding domain-containing protein [Bryobacteraceae bacterium]